MPDLTKDGLEALKESIEKWHEIAATPLDKIDTIQTGIEHCPLCQLFVQQEGHCANCPVAIATGAQACAESPYVDFSIALDDYESNCAQDHCGVFASKVIDAAKSEVAFLESLFPKNQ